MEKNSGIIARGLMHSSISSKALWHHSHWSGFPFEDFWIRRRRSFPIYISEMSGVKAILKWAVLLIEHLKRRSLEYRFAYAFFFGFWKQQLKFCRILCIRQTPNYQKNGRCDLKNQNFCMALVQILRFRELRLVELGIRRQCCLL
jgi:hypothetical protein